MSNASSALSLCPPELLAFGEDVRQWIRANLPTDIRDTVLGKKRLSMAMRHRWWRILNQKGWGAPGWPVEHGGIDWSLAQRNLFNVILEIEGGPTPNVWGLKMIGPVLMAFGSPEQKAYYLPRILNCDDQWCQGFSEPGAGSDLASLRTSAELVGNEWVINGQKIWTTEAHNSNLGFFLVRTEKTERPQQGISMMIIDMSTPGITVRPIITLDGEHDTNEVFLDNVRVPATNLIGERGKGWTYAKYLLKNERLSMAHIGRVKRDLVTLKQIAGKAYEGGVAMLDLPYFREKVAEAEIDVLVLEASNQRILEAAAGGDGVDLGAGPNLLKIKGSETIQSLAELMVEAAGPYALPFTPEARKESGATDPVGPDYSAFVMPEYFFGRCVTIVGGANEVQRNIIAKTVLGL